jgi:hypothetical protein
MAGYAVECAIKACIARNMGQYPFPLYLKETDLRQSYYTHNLETLLKTANLDIRLAQAESNEFHIGHLLECRYSVE